MQLVVQNEAGKAIASLSDYTLDLQYGDGDCDFQLYTPNVLLKPKWRILSDGTSFGGIIDKRCPSSTEDGDTIMYKGRSVQGILKSHIIEPPAGKSHYVVSGEANRVIDQVLKYIGLDEFFVASAMDSGLYIDSYTFYRYVDAYTGLRMMLAKYGARTKILCADDRHEIRAVAKSGYGSADSEKLFFELEIVDLPINHLIGLGRGEGVERAVCHWFADINGNLSQAQTLFGELENAKSYNLSSEEDDILSSKTKSKLKEYQMASEATLTLPPNVSLDVGDQVELSVSKFDGIHATAEVIQVVLKAALGVQEVEYKFGVPDYPEEED